jgi:hypothetical protein
MTSIFNFDTTLLLQAFGLIFIALGVMIRMGNWKNWYWGARRSGYSYLPIGVIFLMYSFNDQVSARLGSLAWIYLACYAIPVAVGVWWVVRTPTFLKPQWVRWVETYPESTFQAMRQAALADPRWERNVASPEAIRAWVKALERGKPVSGAGTKASS